MEPLSPRKRHTYLTILTVLFFIGGPLLVGYSFGYRINKLSWIAKTGGVTVTLREPKTTIYIDGEEVRQTNFLQRNYFFQNMTPGTYNVSTEKEGFYTWQSVVTVFPEYVTGTFPLMIQKEIPFVEIPEFVTKLTEDKTEINVINDEYVAIDELIATTTKAATLSDVRTFNDITATKKSNGFVFEWEGGRNNAPYYFCGFTECVSSVEIPVEGNEVVYFDFYPGREDALIVLTRAGLLVFNIDSEHNTQVFSLYSGDDITFAIQDRNIYVKDGKKIGRLDY